MAQDQSMFAQTTNCSLQYKRLPTLAERLGVQPYHPDDGDNTMVITMCDGTAYDLFKLINSLLDRIDAATKSPVVQPSKHKPKRRISARKPEAPPRTGQRYHQENRP